MFNKQTTSNAVIDCEPPPTTLTLPVAMLYVWTVINVGRPQDIFPFVAQIYPGQVVAAISAGSYFMFPEPSVKTNASPFSHMEARLFLYLSAVMVLTTPFSYYPSLSLEFMKAFIWKFGLYFFLFVKLINTPQRIAAFLYTLLFSGLLIGTSALLFSGSQHRVSIGGMYDPNDLAMLMVTLLPLCLIPFLASRKWYGKAFAGIASTLMLAALLATQSRGGFIGLITVGAWYGCIGIPRISRIKLTVILSVVTILFVSMATEQYMDRMQTITEESQDGAGRLLIWKRSLKIAFDHPLLGVGPAAYMTAYGDYLNNDRFDAELSAEVSGGKWQTAHNTYLLILVELGFVGFLIFFMILLRTYSNLRHTLSASLPFSKSPNNAQIYAAALSGSLTGFAICGIFLSQSYNGLIYEFCWLSGVLVRQNQRKPMQVDPKITSRRL
ncbi:O-antigen ligase family protein [Desulforhabdus amnigena]|nr:O-antigen ligase family protein [Desulforhabdus amnigena]